MSKHAGRHSDGTTDSRQAPGTGRQIANRQKDCKSAFVDCTQTICFVDDRIEFIVETPTDICNEKVHRIQITHARTHTHNYTYTHRQRRRQPPPPSPPPQQRLKINCIKQFCAPTCAQTAAATDCERHRQGARPFVYTYFRFVWHLFYKTTTTNMSSTVKAFGTTTGTSMLAASKQTSRCRCAVVIVLLLLSIATCRPPRQREPTPSRSMFSQWLLYLFVCKATTRMCVCLFCRPVDRDTVTHRRTKRTGTDIQCNKRALRIVSFRLVEFFSVACASRRSDRIVSLPSDRLLPQITMTTNAWPRNNYRRSQLCPLLSKLTAGYTDR